MYREIRTTADGSHTLFIPELNEPYHSVNGAITESEHIFIRNGLLFMKKEKISILEFGFGTGLNALLTAMEAKKRELSIHYTAIEKYPLTTKEVASLNYPQILGEEANPLFIKIHEASWDENIEIFPGFTLHKINNGFLETDHFPVTDLVYFDAFAPEIQPELWSEELFKKIARNMNNNGILVTYSSKGSVKRALQSAGFNVEKVPGPPGKREITRAILTNLNNSQKG